ncbi:MAG: hypothetical protein MR543_08730 [Robinsoniella sp.]|nr:hypothetical protein [Robinsoniella sp.]
MKDDIHFTSRLLACSGFLMTGSGILMAWCGKLGYGGIFWAAASCIFFSAYHFRLQENKIKQTEEYENEK